MTCQHCGEIGHATEDCWDVDYISSFHDHIYELHKDKMFEKASRDQERMDTISLLKSFRNPDVDEV